MNQFTTTTTNSIEGWDIKEYLQPVSSNVVVGSNIFSDFTASITDFFGGRSGSYERRLNEIYDQAIKNLINKAKSIGANSIVGLKIDFGEVSGKGTQMFMISAVGTPVKAIKRGEDINSSQPTDYHVFDGELVERKVRAKKLVNALSAAPEIEKISEASVSFIVESKLAEFSQIVLAILNKWSYYTESLEKLNTLKAYFGNIDRDIAIDAFYSYVNTNEIGDDSRERLVAIAIDYNLIEYSKLDQLLDSEIMSAKKFALYLLANGKQVYTQDDVESLNRYVDNIPESFKVLGTTDQVKGMFSSTPKNVWICVCGTKNKQADTYCSQCEKDMYGFSGKEIKPSKVVEILKDRLEVLSAFVQ